MSQPTPPDPDPGIPDEDWPYPTIPTGPQAVRLGTNPDPGMPRPGQPHPEPQPRHTKASRPRVVDAACAVSHGEGTGTNSARRGTAARCRPLSPPDPGSGLPPWAAASPGG